MLAISSTAALIGSALSGFETGSCTRTDFEKAGAVGIMFLSEDKMSTKLIEDAGPANDHDIRHTRA